VLTSRSALEGERKQVTVLFVDIVDSSRLAQRLDPEVMHQLMDRTLRLMADAVHRYEGTVNQFLGDGLMALFGAPLALEDHAFRAVQAALTIRETVSGYSEQLKHEGGMELRLRLGLNSGLVVVGKIGDELRMDYTAIGDTTHLAARMQEVAEPGAIFITDATHRLVEGYVRTEPVGPVRVKGYPEPVSVFRVTGRRRRRSRLEVSADLGLTELIGRERELGMLRDCFARVKAGRGHVVGIVGEAGAGKSRLLYEFRKSLEGERVSWLEGHCVPYGQTTPYLPVLEICKANFQIEDEDNPLQIDDKLRQGLRQLDLDVEGTLPFLRELLGLPDEDDALRHLDPKDKRQRTFEALRAITFAGSRHRPQVFVFEDLQWIDKTSEDYLVFLAESLAAASTLLVATHRPGYAVRWADRTYYSGLAVGVLAEREVDALLSSLLGVAQAPPDLVRVVWEKAEGNPLFVEEIVKSLCERGLVRRGNGGFTWSTGAAVEVPGNVQDIIRARLDQLEDAVKRTAQTAAVIGREFGLTVLTRVSERGAEVPRHLDTLKRVEMVHETSLFPQLKYGFTHGVIQDVAYQMLLLQRRKELHGAIGRAIEDLYADRLDEQAPILAYHYARSERQDRAVVYALLAGDLAARLYANPEATTYYEQALAMARALSASPDAGRAVIDATLKVSAVGATRQDVIERDRQSLETARALAEDLGDERRLAQVLYWLGRIAYVLWQPPTAIAYARQSLEIAERLGDDGLAAPPVNLMGRIYWQQSDYTQASQLLERSAEQMRRLGNKTEESTAAGFAGFALGFMGEFDRAITYADHGLQLARDIKNPFAEATVLLDRAIVLSERGDWALAFIDFENARRIAEAVGDLFRIYVVKIFEGRALTMAGDPSRGRELIEQSAALGAQIGTRFALAWQKSFLAHALLALGQLEAVPALCEEAIRLADEVGDRFPKAFAHRTLAEALLNVDPRALDKAEDHMREAIRIHREIGTWPELARCYVSYVRLLRGAGQRERADELLANALTMFRDVGMTRHLDAARRALGES
jgi:class 3 adenylate cyclase/tetratricopeptide (TPR) repeat protein